jgi:phosphoribosylglycinamide formyltransferase-1
VPSPARAVVLLSGLGSTCAALIAAQEDPVFGLRIVAVGSDRADAAGLRHARHGGIPTFVVAPRDHPSRSDWDRALTAAVREHEPDLVVCAGFMRLLGPAYLEVYEGRTVNTHPALLPAFPGAHAVRDALAYGVRLTGCTVHLVDEGVDTGPVVAQAAVEVLPHDDEASLHARIKAVERDLLVETVGRMARHGWRVQGRHVHVG